MTIGLRWFSSLALVTVFLLMTRISCDPLTDSEVEQICENPHYEVLKGKLLDNYDSFDVLYGLSNFANASSLPKYERTVESCYVQNSAAECASLQSAANTDGGDTCPGRYERNIDADRVPCAMWEFKCLCQNCLIPASLHTRNRTARCQPIYRYIPAMRRTLISGGGLDDWTYSLEPVVVGCRCAGHEHRRMSSRW